MPAKSGGTVEDFTDETSASANDVDSRSGIDLLALSSPDTALLQVVADKLVAECMSAKGFQYVPLDLATATAAVDSDLANRRTDLPYDMSIEGSDYMPLIDAPAPAFDNDAYANSLEPGERQAWSDAALGNFDDTINVVLPGGISFDFPKDGCLTEGRVSTFGSIEAAIGFEGGLSRIRIDSRLRTEADQEVIAAISNWSDCMRKSTGRTFAHFSDARRSAYADSSVSKAVATADASCTASTGLGEAYNRTLARHTQELIDENASQLEAYSTSILAALDEAKD